MNETGHKDEWLTAIDTAYQCGRITKRKWLGLRILYLFSGGQPKPKRGAK